MVEQQRSADDDHVTFLRRIPVHWYLYAATLASALPIAAITAGSTPMPEGACSGIGWGCSLYEWDAAGFMLLIFGIPYAMALTTVLFILSFVGKKGAPIVATIGLVIPWVLTLLIALSD